MRVTREEVERALATGDPDALTRALIAVAFHEPDVDWAQERCLAALEHPSAVVRGLAATCLGHLARIHRRIDLARVRPRLEAMRSDPLAGKRAGDALVDIERYLGPE
jgi:hypothetical protein